MEYFSSHDMQNKVFSCWMFFWWELPINAAFYTVRWLMNKLHNGDHFFIETKMTNILKENKFQSN